MLVMKDVPVQVVTHSTGSVASASENRYAAQPVWQYCIGIPASVDLLKTLPDSVAQSALHVNWVPSVGALILSGIV